MAAMLIGVRGEQAGQTIQLTAVDLTIGRDAANSVAIADPQLSRNHLKISWTDAGYLAQDLGSANGVIVNGFRISMPTILHPGDQIEVGAQTFRFEAGLIPSTTPKEKSRAEVPWQPTPFAGRPTEYGSKAGPDYLSGCMPNLSGLATDMQGCLAALVRAIPWIIGIIIAFILFHVLMLGCGVLGGMLGGIGHGGSHGPSPAPNTAPAGDQPKDGPQNSEHTPMGNPDVQIIEVKVLPKRPDSTNPTPVAFFKWKNVSGHSVVLVEGELVVRNSMGEVVLRKKAAPVYRGLAVADRQTHEDLGGKDGIDLPADIDPDKAEVTVTQVK